MKRIIRITAFLLAIVLCCGGLGAPFCGAAETVVPKTMMQYCSLNLTFPKPEEKSYSCAVSGNAGNYITVDANNEGNYYWLMVRAKKPTEGRKQPIITVYETVDGEKTQIKRFQITVNAAKKVAMSDVNINKGTAKNILLKNPYDYDYKFSYNTKLIKLTPYLFNGEKEYFTLKGLQNGKTTVKAYLKGTKQLIGSFTVTVGNFKAYIKKNYQNITLAVNSHIDSRYLAKGSINLAKAVGHYHADGVYTVKCENPKLAAVKTVGKTALTPKAVQLLAKKTGKTKVLVYEQRGKNKKQKIGTITLTVKKAKDSAVFTANRSWDNDGIFYDLEIAPGESFNLKKAVVNRYINSVFTGSHFKESEYSFSAVSNAPEIIAVDANGICTCLAPDPQAKNKISYTVTFKDGSKASGGGSFCVCVREEDEAQV